MRYGIFSDIHSNLEAFEAVCEAYLKEAIDQYLCIGDIIGYAADPGECVKTLRNLNALAVSGNHEWGACAKYHIENFSPSAKASLIWTIARLTPEENMYIKGLPLFYSHEDFILVHSALDAPEEFYYLNNYDEAVKTFALLKEKICFIGHTHKPGAFMRNARGFYFKPFTDTEITLKENEDYIINVGSVGQPRDGDKRASFAVYDSEKRSVSVKRVNYDIEAARKKIIRSGLPEKSAERLALGE